MRVWESFCKSTFNRVFSSISLEKIEGNATSVSSLDYSFYFKPVSSHKVDKMYTFKNKQMQNLLSFY